MTYTVSSGMLNPTQLNSTHTMVMTCGMLSFVFVGVNNLFMLQRSLFIILLLIFYFYIIL